MMKKLISLALAGALMLALAACGGDEPGNINDVSPAPPPPASQQPSDAPSSGGAQELIFVLSNEPDGIDPGVTNNSFAKYVLNNCFEGLVTYDESGSVVPGNAESWDISDDGTVYTFHLRSGLKWSDGSPLTAQDYVYAYQRVLTPATAAQYMSMFTDYIVNAKEFYEGSATADELGIKALDDTTLEITLMKPTAYFVDLASMWCFDPVQKATIDANGERWTASADSYICNGPFKMTAINMGEGYVLEKNEHYWNADSVTLEKLTFRIITDNATALTAYESGEVDGITAIPAADYSRLKASDPGFNSFPSYSTTYYNINCSKAPYDDPLVRKALALAIDRQAIIDSVLQGRGVPAYSYLSPGYVVDGKDITDGRSDNELTAGANVEAARAALAEAGYPNGEGFPTLQLSYYSSDTVKMIAEAMAEMLQNNLGIKVDISSNDWAVFYDSVQAGNYEVAAMGWSADYQHPMSFLPLFKTGDSSNNSFYSNSEYDALVEQVMVESDPAKAAELIMQAEAIAAGDYCCLPLYYGTNTFLMKDYVSGYYMTSSSNLYFQNVKVNK